jgi:hypothetical protein
MKLDFYTFDKTLLELLPVKRKVQNPSWWSKLKKFYYQYDVRSGIKIPAPTVKLCPGVADYIRNSIDIKLWTDVIFKVKPNGQVTVATPLTDDGRMPISMHDDKQTGPELYPDRTVVKLTNPWAVKASDRTQFLVTENHYTEDLREHGIMVSPGLTNFYDQHALNIFLVFPIKEEEYEVTLQYGSTLMSLHPLTEKNVDVNCSFMNNEDFNGLLANFPNKFFGRYYAKRKVTK